MGGDVHAFCFGLAPAATILTCSSDLSYFIVPSMRDGGNETCFTLMAKRFYIHIYRDLDA